MPREAEAKTHPEILKICNKCTMVIINSSELRLGAVGASPSAALPVKADVHDGY